MTAGAAIDPRMTSPLRILHLEDDPRDAELIQVLLEAEGFICQVTRVDTRADFLASLGQGGFDLILADYTLPAFDGLSALALTLDHCPEVPLIFVSGTLGEEVAIEALKIGATDYVLKGRLSRIVPSVRRALREAQERTTGKRAEAERLRSEAALRRSEAYLSEAQRLSHTGSFGWVVSTGEIFWSEESFRIFQYDPTTRPNVELVLQRVHPEDAVFVQQTMERASQDGKDMDFEHRLMMSDGSIKHVRVVGRSASGHSTERAFVGAVMDVTERKRAERALRRARERALEARFAAVLDERTRLARDIHDTLLQGFTGIALKLVAAIGRVTEPVESVVALRDLVRLAQQTLTDARRAVWDLRSPALAGGDFPAAVRNAAEDCVRGTKLELEYDVGGPSRPVDPNVEAVVVRVAQEAITNVVKHADAASVRVALSFETRRVRLSVIDDGRGFVVASDFRLYGGHWGLLGMRERASQVHGELSLRSTPGHGTELVLLVPYAVQLESPTARPESSSAS